MSKNCDIWALLIHYIEEMLPIGQRLKYKDVHMYINIKLYTERIFWLKWTQNEKIYTQIIAKPICSHFEIILSLSTYFINTKY